VADASISVRVDDRRFGKLPNLLKPLPELPEKGAEPAAFSDHFGGIAVPATPASEAGRQV
jgi:hypothetical protein